MEKIKTNYLLLSIFTLFFSLAFFIVIKIKYEYWWAIFFTILPIIYLYIIENFTKAGYYFSKDGISTFKNGHFNCTQWNQISAKKSPLGVIITFADEKFNIDISRHHSAKKLIMNHCPINHELFKIFDDNAQKSNIPF